MGGEFDGALPDEVKEVKIFSVGGVGDGNANCAKTTGRQRPPDVKVSALSVCGRVAARWQSNSGWMAENYVPSPTEGMCCRVMDVGR